jgi:hypothetical protein
MAQASVIQHLGPESLEPAMPFGEGAALLAQALPHEGAEATEKNPAEVRSAISDTPQEHLEELITAGLERIWPSYAERGKVLSVAKLGFLSSFASIRGGLMRRRTAPVPEQAKARNMAALDSLVNLARADDVEVLIYKPPHRPGEAVFYHQREKYDAFFDAASRYCSEKGVHYLDLETIVPAQYWGFTNGRRPDVFHFQDYGHRQLARHIDAFFARTWYN